jgi:hypothetical protein
MRVVWLADTHLDFLSERRRRRFVDQVADRRPEIVLVSGDLADGWTVVPCLRLLDARLRCPVAFVLGNHDYYHRAIAAVRQEVRAAVAGTSLCYLPVAGVVPLGRGVAVLGHDGWADGRCGDAAGSSVVPHDFRHIHDFQVFADRASRLRLMQSLADEAAAYVGRVLPLAAASHAHVLVVTHVPPFAGASWYRGRPSGPDRLPFYASRCLGEAVLAALAPYPTCQVTVLAGHTHGRVRYAAAPNVEVWTAEATYGRPRIAGVFEVGQGEHGGQGS